MRKKVRKPQYSGDASEQFWASINKVPHSEGGLLLYTMGCILQDVEGRVLKELRLAEEKRARGTTQKE